MTDVQLTTIPPQLALVVSKRASLTTVAERMHEAFTQLMGHVQATGATVTGPPFSIYPEMPSDDFTFLTGVPVAPGAKAGDGVELQELPAGDAAVLTHKGPYDALAEQYARLTAWVETSGRTPAAPPREVYLNDARTVPPEDLLTELGMPRASPGARRPPTGEDSRWPMPRSLLRAGRPATSSREPSRPRNGRR